MINKHVTINVYAQQGVSLILAMVMVLFLTLIAVSAGDLNNIQQLMARNHQYNNEAFNEAYAEIEAQVAFLNTEMKNGTDQPDIVKNIGKDKGITSVLNRTRTITKLTGEELSFAYLDDCVIEGKATSSELDSDIDDCMVFRITSSVGIPDSSLGSKQEQIVEMNLY